MHLAGKCTAVSVLLFIVKPRLPLNRIRKLVPAKSYCLHDHQNSSGMPLVTAIEDALPRPQCLSGSWFGAVVKVSWNLTVKLSE